MKISYNWLKTLIDIDLPAEKVGALLTGSGLEIEHIAYTESVKGGLEGLVTGYVTECGRHPNADKLSLTKVDTGSGTLLSIVCGAPNVGVGQKVVVAPVGCTVYPTEGEPFKIKEAKIRGELSQGMICAEDEIGLGKSHEGIMILPEDTPVGLSARDYFGVETDAVFEIGLTANRGDAASHLGVARELSALLRKPYKKPEANISQSNENPFSVSIADADACARYSGILIQGVTVKESPAWLQNRLRAIDLNPINNIVDCTNYVLHELGQPIHAFDADQLTGKQIQVKYAEQGMKFITLDGVERTMNATDLMIWDAKKPVAIAGVFGGKDSGVSSSTVNVFIESAYFDPAVVRKTAKSHGLSTDASFRFERGCNPDITIFALQRISDLILETAGGHIASQVYDTYPRHIMAFTVHLRRSAITAVCGISIPDSDIESILRYLEIEIRETVADGWILGVPAYRSDVNREIDVIEELIRIYGFDNIPLKPEVKSTLSYSRGIDKRKLEQRTGQYLQSQGFHEMMSNSLSKERYYIGDEELVEIMNPLSQDLGVLRKQMLYSGLEAIAWNRNRKNMNVKLYEFGKTYSCTDGQFNEQEHLSLFICGNTEEEGWTGTAKKADYFYLKQHVINVLSRLGIADKADKLILEMGEVNQKTLKQFDISATTVWYADLDWKLCCRAAGKHRFALKELPVFPVVRRDLSLVLDKSVTFEQIQNIALKTNNKKITDINVFDVYEGKPLDAGQKSYSVSFMLYDSTKTMSDKDIDGIMSKLIENFETQLGAVIRK